MEEILRLIFTTVFSEYGIIGACFLILLLWTMRENKERENRYQATIEKNQEIILEQAKNFDIVKEVRNDVSDLKSVVMKNLMNK